jgi:hypothetical protein
MTIPTTKDCAGYALHAVEAFASKTGLEIETDGLETAVSDLLADLMHLCDKEDLDFETCVARAEGHYHEERLEENPDYDPRPCAGPNGRLGCDGCDGLPGWCEPAEEEDDECVSA